MFRSSFPFHKLLLGLLLISTGINVNKVAYSNATPDSIELILKSLPDSLKIPVLLEESRKLQSDQITEAINLARNAKELSILQGNDYLSGISDLRLAELYFLKGVYEKSLEFALEALGQFEKTGSGKNISGSCQIIGDIYGAMENYSNAIAYYQKALDINKNSNRITAVAETYTRLGSAFVAMDSVDKGLTFYLVSLMISDSLGLTENKTRLLIQIGNGFFRLEKWEESLKNYYLAMELAALNKNLYDLADAKSKIGVTYYQMNNIPAAMKYSQESLSITRALKTFRIAGESYKNLSEIYASQHNYKKAYDYFVLFKNASDSLLNEEKSLQIAKLQTTYDLLQKERENELLKLQNIHKSRTIRRLFIAASLIVVLLAFSLLEVYMLIKLNKTSRYLNLRLSEQGKELEELNDQKDKFFSFVAHNLKNPFNTIMGFSELMVMNKDKNDPEKSERYAKHILGLSVHVHKILDNLLEWSRLQRRNFEYKPEKIEVGSLIRDVMEMNKKEAMRKDIGLHHNITDKLPAYADRFMVTTILQNLMSNALNFTPSSGKISITGKQTGKVVEVSVTDTGIGIAPEDISKLFRIDVQPAKIGSTESKGAGLGLVICREMIQRCNGEINIESNLSKGTRVTFTLPISNGSVVDTESKDLPQPDFVLEIKRDMENTGKFPAAFTAFCQTVLLPRYQEVRSVLALENLMFFARDVEECGKKYNVQSFIHFGSHLSLLLETHQIDKILKVLPEFKKMIDTFAV